MQLGGGEGGGRNEIFEKIRRTSNIFLLTFKSQGEEGKGGGARAFQGQANNPSPPTMQPWPTCTTYLFSRNINL